MTVPGMMRLLQPMITFLEMCQSLEIEFRPTIRQHSPIYQGVVTVYCRQVRLSESIDSLLIDSERS